MDQDDDAPDRMLATHDAPGRPPISDTALCQHILAAIVELTTRSGRPPTYREVLAHMGLTSHRRLSAGLDELVRTGQLRRLSGSRNLIVLQYPSPTMK